MSVIKCLLLVCNLVLHRKGGRKFGFCVQCASIRAQIRVMLRGIMNQNILVKKITNARHVETNTERKTT